MRGRHSLLALLALFIKSTGRAIRRNPCTLVLIVLLSPWAFILWQINSHFGSLSVSPLKAFHAWSIPAAVAPPTPSPVLLVTAYYPLSRSRYPMQQYNIWLSNLLSRVTTDIYMFAPPDMEYTLRSLRGQLPIYINTTYASIHDLPVVSDFLNEFAYQYSKDRNAQKYSPELYMLRTAKPWFLREGLHNVQAAGSGVSGQADPYRFAFWVDASNMRERNTYSDWPSADRVELVWTEGERISGTAMDDLMFVPIDRLLPEQFARWTPKEGPILSKTEFSEGSFFGGPPRAVEWWADAFYDVMRDFVTRGHPVRNERVVMNSLLVLHPTRFITVWNRDPVVAGPAAGSGKEGGLGSCGSPWFYYAFWLANEGERDEMNVLWSATGWRLDFWRERTFCSMTRTLAIKDVLMRTFGPAWRPPTQRISSP